MRPALLAPLLLVACAEFPALDGTVSPEQRNAPYPDLVPLAPLVAEAQGSMPAEGAFGGAEAAADALAPRIAALRARAAGLRGPVIPPAVRARMLRGVR